MRAEDRALFELAAANDFLVGHGQLRAAGVSSAQWRRRVASGEWVAVVPGVWCHAATPRTWELQVRAGAFSLGSPAALAGQAAARWWGLDGFDDVDDVEFAVPHGRRSRSGQSIHIFREWSRKDFLMRLGVQVTTVTRAIRVDFLFEAEKLVVEVSGRVGHASDADRRKDARRRNDLVHRGLRFIEFTTADVIDDPTYVVGTVRTSLSKGLLLGLHGCG